MTLHRSDEAGRDLNAGERSQEAPPPRTAAFQNHRIHAAFQKTILAQHALSTSRHGKSTITLSEQFHFIANRSLPVLLFSNSDRKLRIGHFQLPIHGVGIENGLAQRYTDREGQLFCIVNQLPYPPNTAGHFAAVQRSNCCTTHIQTVLVSFFIVYTFYTTNA